MSGAKQRVKNDSYVLVRSRVSSTSDVEAVLASERNLDLLEDMLEETRLFRDSRETERNDDSNDSALESDDRKVESEHCASPPRTDPTPASARELKPISNAKSGRPTLLLGRSKLSDLEAELGEPSNTTVARGLNIKNIASWKTYITEIPSTRSARGEDEKDQEEIVLEIDREVQAAQDNDESVNPIENPRIAMGIIRDIIIRKGGDENLLQRSLSRIKEANGNADKILDVVKHVRIATHSSRRTVEKNRVKKFVLRINNGWFCRNPNKNRQRKRPSLRRGFRRVLSINEDARRMSNPRQFNDVELVHGSGGNGPAADSQYPPPKRASASRRGSAITDIL